MGLQAEVWNRPHALHPSLKVTYQYFSTPPKTLDPARSYSSDEALFLAQIVEPPLHYAYLKRPYILQPATLAAIPALAFYDQRGKKLPSDVDHHKIAYSEYRCELEQGIKYQPHPAFAKTKNKWRYWPMQAAQWRGISALSDFQYTGTRVLLAQDYVYGIKRLADPRLSSPIYGYMANKIVGLSKLSKQLEQAIGSRRDAFIDLRAYRLDGVRALSDHAFSIRIKGYDPQFKYWLAMTFFSPIPWEADRFYAQHGMKAHNIAWDNAPVGTGPYYLSTNRPYQQMVLSRNPHYHHDVYPHAAKASADIQDQPSQAGALLPMIDRYIFYLEKESIPRWVKFMQGYYDSMSVSADHFTQAISVDATGQMALTDAMKKRGIYMQSQTEPSIYFLGFNMLDPVVGGNTESARLLRHAIALTVDFGEYIQLFLNGRGKLAGGPIPPGISGFKPMQESNMSVQQRLVLARKKLAQAGYPHGIDPATGRPLMLYYDVAVASSADSQAMLAWMRKQFAKLGIALQIRSTQYQRFQTKVRTGKAQLFSWGWSADYPDPENFLFLFYGPNAKVRHGGENAVNYHSQQYDQWFEQLKWLGPGIRRQALIDKMVTLLQHDAPWVWGYYPKSLVLRHGWVAQTKINAMARDTFKYANLDPKQRQLFIVRWNQPARWLAWVLVMFVVLLGCVLYGLYLCKQKAHPVARHDTDKAH